MSVWGKTFGEVWGEVWGQYDPLTITGTTFTVASPFTVSQVVGDASAHVTGGTTPYVAFTIVSQQRQGA